MTSEVLSMWLNAVFVGLSLGLFLIGLRVMRRGLEGMGQGQLPHVLKRFVKTPTRGILTGTLITALVQSSAAVTAITVGMVASGSMVFRDALGIVLGANVGSTLTPQLLTLNLNVLIVPCVVLGFAGALTNRPTLRNLGLALIGFASIVASIEALSAALHPLSQTQWFRNSIQQAANPLFAVLVGCGTSALVQSSTATTVITMALAEQSLIPLHGGIAIVLGANIGTCFTSILAALGQTRAAQQVALSHVLLNVGGVVLFLPFLAPYTDLMVRMAAEPAQQIANAHTIFNIVCTVLIWPVTSQFANGIQRLLPDNRSA